MRLRVCLFSSTIQLSLLLRWPYLKQSTGKVMISPVRSRVHACTGIVELFKHLLCETAHPQFLVLELQAPMGAYLGQYSKQN